MKNNNNVNKLYFGKDSDDNIKAFTMGNVHVSGGGGEDRTCFVDQVLLNGMSLSSSVSKIYYFTEFDSFKLTKKREGTVEAYVFNPKDDSGYEDLELFLRKVTVVVESRIGQVCTDTILVAMDDIGCLLADESNKLKIVQTLDTLMRIGIACNVYFILCDGENAFVPSTMDELFTHRVELMTTCCGDCGVLVKTFGKLQHCLSTICYDLETLKKINKSFSKKVSKNKMCYGLDEAHLVFEGHSIEGLKETLEDIRRAGKGISGNNARL